MRRRDRATYISDNPQKRAKSLANLTQNRPGLTKIKSPFLRDKRNLDVRYFLENSIILESGRKMVLQPWQKKLLDITYPSDNSRPYSTIIISTTKKSGKSTFISALGLWELLFHSKTVSPEIYSVALDTDQARLVHDSAKKMIKRNKDLKKICKVYRDRIEVPARDGLFRVLSADVDSSEGKNPSTVIMDELGIGKWELFCSLQSGQAAREGSHQAPVALIASTAGYNLTSPFYTLCRSALKKEIPGVYIFEDHNPRLSSWITEKFLRGQKAILPPDLYMRYFQNRWVPGAGQFLTENDVNACTDQFLLRGSQGRKKVFCGLDVGLSGDYSALSAVNKDYNGMVSLVDHRVFIPGKNEKIDLESTVEASLLLWQRQYNIAAVFYDPWQCHRSASALRQQGLKMTEVPQSESNIIKYSQILFSLFRDRKIRLYPDDMVREHLLNCGATQTNRGWKITKKSKNRKIDLTISLSLACLGVESSASTSGDSGFRAVMFNEHGQPIFGNISPEVDLLERKEPSIWGMVEEDKKRQAQRRRNPLGNRSWWNEIGQRQR